MSRNDWDDGTEREPGNSDGIVAGLFWVAAVVLTITTLGGSP